MKLFLANIQEVQFEHMSLISPERAERALRYRLPADRKRCIAGGLLLRRFLGDAEVFTDEFGKPRTRGGVCFNLSHSGDWALLAINDREVGCDIEQHQYIDALRIGKTVFTAREREALRAAPDRLGTFYQLWTKKEALLKCMGEGFRRAAKSVDVCGGSFEENGDIFYLKTAAFADYTVSVCVKNASADFEFEFFEIPPLR